MEIREGGEESWGGGEAWGEGRTLYLNNNFKKTSDKNFIMKQSLDSRKKDITQVCAINIKKWRVLHIANQEPALALIISIFKGILPK